MKDITGIIRNHPYQVTTLANLPGEEWRDVPGFEEYYRVSNYGRIKSLSRIIPMATPAGGVYRTPERIRKITLSTTYNKTVKDHLYKLVVSLSRDGFEFNFSVARLVYYTFKEKFDLKDRKIIISFKDKDGRNVQVSNLIKTTFSNIKLESYKKGRAVSHLSALSQPVTQFDNEGEPVQIYPSVYDAAKKTGLNASNIAEVVSGATHMYSGFFWKRGEHLKKLDLGNIKRNVSTVLINKALMDRLGIKDIQPGSPPPFLNLSLEDMPSELWKDVPGYERLYQVSNFGRIKALQKVTTGKQKKWMPEKILRVGVDFRIDANTGKEVAGSTFTSMAKEGKKKLVSIPRLVYHLFVENFDLTDTSWRIYYKDGNTLNVTPENLSLRNGVWSIQKEK